MKLSGSCHCRAVTFSLVSHTPYPYMQCYCSICRKTAGTGGFAINIMGEKDSFEVTGEENVSVYRGNRHFCRHCGSALWIYDEQWPQWIYPHAAAIDTPLPTPPVREHIMLDSKAAWSEVPEGENECQFQGYPDLSIEDWHKNHGLYLE